VFLLTNFRYFGLLFNPISVYFCYDSDANLIAIIDEVTNTPWSERIHYVHHFSNECIDNNDTTDSHPSNTSDHEHPNIKKNPSPSIDAAEDIQKKEEVDRTVRTPTTSTSATTRSSPLSSSLIATSANGTKKQKNGGGGFEFEVRYPKSMHVSPFFEMDYEYHSQFNLPSTSFSMQIELIRRPTTAPSSSSALLVTPTASLPAEEQPQHQQQQQSRSPREFIARLDLKESLPLTQFNLCAILLRFPFMTLKVVWGIYWQALKLWMKGATFYPHPDSTPSSKV